MHKKGENAPNRQWFMKKFAVVAWMHSVDEVRLVSLVEKWPQRNKSV